MGEPQLSISYQPPSIFLEVYYTQIKQESFSAVEPIMCIWTAQCLHHELKKIICQIGKADARIQLYIKTS